MARKSSSVTITAEGRDKGKTFFLSELPATEGERWAMRALSAIARSGIEVPADIASAGMAGIAAVGIRALMGVQFDEAEPLIHEMMGCVQFVPDPGQPLVRRALAEAGPDGEGADIEEIATLLHLRSEVVALHVGFSIREKLSTLGAMFRTRLQDSSNTQTPAEPLEPSSAAD